MNIALLVGINNYYTSGNDLKGCLNDVENMRSLLLKQCGFSLMQIKTLTNAQATRTNILNSLKQMVDQAKETDHLVFQFSGHGSQVPDQLFFNDNEPDGLDEVLCPYDFDFGGIFIRDDNLHKIFKNLNPKTTCDVFLDSCHSGTGLREFGITPKFWSWEANDLPFPYEPPVQERIDAVLPSKIAPIQLHLLPNVILWAGCKSNQTSSDTYINQQHQGAMTWAFIQSFDFNLLKSRKNIINYMVGMLESKGYEQTPQLECSTEMEKGKVFC